MARLTRRESQARTREKLLATATTCFLRDGYAATSLEGIADAAGFSKGAVYSNFKNKDELCFAVIEAVRADRVASLAAAILPATSLEARIAAFEAWAERTIGDQAWTSLEIEFAVHAGRDPVLASRLVRDNETIRSLIVRVIDEHVRESAIALPMASEDVGVALLSLGVGLGLQRALDPSLSVRSLGQLVRLFAQPATNPSTKKAKAKRASTQRRR